MTPNIPALSKRWALAGVQMAKIKRLLIQEVPWRILLARHMALKGQ